MTVKVSVMEFITSLLIILTVFFIPISKAADTGVIVYVKDGIGELQKPEKQTAIELWEMHSHQNEKDYSFRYSLTTVDKFIKQLNLGKIDYVLLDGSNFIRHYSQLASKMKGEAWLAQRTANNFEEFVLLVRTDANINDFQQLKNTTFSLHSGYGLLALYLDQLVSSTGYPSMTKYFKDIRDAKTESQAILDVFFGNSEACLVAKHVFDDAIELNPAIGKQIKIIHQSKKIYAPAIYLALNSVSEKGRKHFSDVVEALNKTTRGRQMLDLFGIYAINRIDYKKLEPMLQQQIAWKK